MAQARDNGVEVMQEVMPGGIDGLEVGALSAVIRHAKRAPVSVSTSACGTARTGDKQTLEQAMDSIDEAVHVLRVAHTGRWWQWRRCR